jgi:hypothetical protein
MERYIGNLKARLSNMASIDANLAHSALRMELLHHLPREPDTSLPTQFPVLGPQIPSHYITDIGAGRTKVSVLPRGVKQQLDLRFGSWTKTWPMKLGIVEADERGGPSKGMERVTLHTTIELQYRLAIGSEYSQGDFPLYRRDNSFISWKVNWRGKDTTCYGQVVVYCKCYDWTDIIVVVRRYNRIYKNSFNQLFVERDDLGGLATIKHTEIVNIIGRIGMNEFGKEILYLILNRAETTLEVYSIIRSTTSKFTNY